jgi:hypothetical protein
MLDFPRDLRRRPKPSRKTLTVSGGVHVAV